MPSRLVTLAASFIALLLVLAAGASGGTGGVGPQARAQVGDPTSTAVVCAPDRLLTLIGGGETTCEAIVEAPGLISPIGSVEFTSDNPGIFSAQPAKCQLTPSDQLGISSCSLNYTPTAAGTGPHQITGRYLGSIKFAESQSFDIVTVVRPTVSSLSCSPGPGRIGENAQCTATVTDATVFPNPPTGIVEFSAEPGVGAFPDGAVCALVTKANGTASCSRPYRPTAIGSGAHQLSAHYPGDLDHFESTGPFKFPVHRTTATTVACKPPALGPKGTTTCTVDVEDKSDPPTDPSGTVGLKEAFNQGSFPEGPTCTLTGKGGGHAQCSFKYSPSQIGTGFHKVDVTYQGDSSHFSSAATTTVVVSLSTTVSCDKTNLAVGDGTICTVTVVDSRPTPTTPAGNVTFSSDSPGTFNGQNDTCTLAALGPDTASCSLVYTPSVVGSRQHKVTALYKGDGDHAPASTATALNVTGLRVRYAAPKAEGKDPCTNPADPCPLSVAVTAFGGARAGDEVILLGKGFSDLFGDFGESPMFIPQGVTVHGADGKPRPGVTRVHGDAGIFLVSPEASLSHVLLVNDTGTSAVELFAGVAEDVVAATARAKAITCVQRGGLIRDSVCRSIGSSAISVGDSVSLPDGPKAVELALRNVTAISSGPESVGLGYLGFGSEPGTSITVDAKSVIAQGKAADVEATARGNAPGNGSHVTVNLDHSDYVTSNTVANNGGIATITPAGSGTNITTPPVFTSDGFHEAPTSPTVNAGSVDSLSGPADIDDQLRVLGAGADIGADELAAPSGTILNCIPGNLAIGGGASASTTCTAFVTSVGDAHGSVDFTSDHGGAFSGNGTCELVASKCSVTFTPIETGTHKVTAAYRGTDRDPSQAVLNLVVGGVRFAAPGGTGSAPCADPADPCSVFTAADSSAPSPAGPGDEVRLAAGEYTDTAGDLGPEGFVKLAEGVTVRGAGGAGRPVIVLAQDHGHGALVVGKNDLVSHLEIKSSVAVSELQIHGGIAEDVIARSSAPAPGIACDQTAGLIRDSVCSANGAGAVALGSRQNASGEVTLSASVRNVTALATGEGSAGLLYSVAGVEAAPTFNLDAKSVIADGATDIVAEGLSQTQNPGDGAHVNINLENSDYASANGIADGGAGTVFITPPGSGTNVEAPAQLAADGIHQLASSPTVDKGAIDVLGGESDIDAQHRTIGAAPDIGADELGAATTTSLSCDPEAVAALGQASCTATAESSSGGELPTGKVSFHTAGPGAFSPTSCDLLADPDGESASCEFAVTYTPQQLGGGTHLLEATYAGDAEHDGSEGEFSLAVSARETETRLACAPSGVEVAEASVCTATVVDLTGEVGHEPEGQIEFSQEGNGTFEPSRCKTEAVGGEFSCKVSYTPAERGEHSLTASYQGDEVQAPSSGTTTIEGTKHRVRTILTCTPNPVVDHHATHCAVTVEDTAGDVILPTGKVAFDSDGDGAFSASECVLVDSGDSVRATCGVDYTPAAGASAVQRLKATYSGDDEHDGETTTVSLGVEAEGAVRNPTETAVDCEPVRVALGEASTCEVTVTAAVGEATGTVELEADGEGEFSATSCDVAADLARSSALVDTSCSVTFTPTGQRTTARRITAFYGGDQTHAFSVGVGRVTLKPDTATTLSCDPGSVPHGDSTHCRATVTDSSAEGAADPEGEVFFADLDEPGAFDPGTCELQGNGDGSASCEADVTYTPEALGPHRLRATYPESAGHGASAGELTVKVTPVGPHPTRATLLCAPSPVGVLEPTHCTATIEDLLPESVATTPAGEFSFGGGNGAFAPQVCSPAPAGDGKSSSCGVDFSSGVEGDQQLEAGFHDGGGSHADSQASFTVHIGIPPDHTETKVKCVPNPVFVGVTTICTAEVLDTDAPGARPTGIVHFTSDNPRQNFLGAGADCTLPATGANECRVFYNPGALPDSGQDTIGAEYQGDDAHAESTAQFLLTVDTTARHPTASLLTCAPDPVGTGEATHCTATVEDVLPRVGATTPGGTFTFASENGSFSGEECAPQPTGDGRSASCEVDFSSNVTGVEELAATYVADETHLDSNASFPLHVGTDPDASQTTVTCSPDAVLVRAQTECTVSVADAETPGSRPSGTVHLTSDNPQRTFPGPDGPECTLPATGASECTIPYSPKSLPASGHDALEAIYLGDETHHGSSGTTALTVTAAALHQTATVLSCDPDPFDAGASTHCTATVEDLSAGEGASEPHGEVAFSADEGEFSAAACAPTASGDGRRSSCEVDFSADTAGVKHLKAGFHDDSLVFAPSKDTFAAHAGVTADATETTLVCAPASVVLGGETECTALVADAEDAGNRPTGTVHFTSDNAEHSFPSQGGPDCTLPADGPSQCTVTYKPEALGGAGHDTIAAQYGGDDTHGASSGQVELPVTHAVDPTMTTLECVPSPIPLGGAVACTASVEDAAAEHRSFPTGEIEFDHVGPGQFGNGGRCALFSVSPIEARCQVLFIPAAAGNQELAATYEGDGEHAGSATNAQLQTTAPTGGHATAANLSCEPGSVALGGLAVCEVTVSDTSNAKSSPGGAVVLLTEGAGTFDRGGCILFPVGAASSKCQVIYKPSEVRSGAHKIVALYPGDQAHNPAQPASDTVLVSAPNGGHLTRTALSCQPESVQAGSPTRCKATVNDLDGPVTPGAGVLFATDQPGSFDAGGCQLIEVQSGIASCEVTYTPGVPTDPPHKITAAYDGDPGQGGGAAHQPSSTTADVTVTAAPAHDTQTSVACAPPTLKLGSGQARCTITVKDVAQRPTTPGGEVAFSREGAGSGDAKCQLSGNGATATCTVNYTPGAAGNPKLTAAYQGDAGHKPSAGETRIQVDPAGSQQPPSTRLLKKPRKKTVSRTAVFRFSSDRPGSSFQCKLDRKPFKDCRSPFKARKLKPGRHTFRVRAIAPGGLADPTPATYTWKVGKPSGHRR